MPKMQTALGRLNSTEALSEKNTCVHRLHPAVKTVITVIYILCVISYNRYQLNGLITLAVLPFIVMPLAEIPISAIVKRMLVALPFALLAAISNLIFDTKTVFFIKGFAVTFGMLAFGSVIIKTALTVTAVLLLVSTTPFTKLLAVVQAVHLPQVLIMQLTLTQRYIYVLVEEAQSTYTAYRLRAGNVKGVQIRDMGTLLGGLLLRSIHRAERIYNAMHCRGFKGEYPAQTIKKVSVTDIFTLVAALSVLAVLRFIPIAELLGKVLFF
ncbi:MAG: cobalt ECF transporter T component CbiQ [Oscillospiraceae bacterium]|nr:cobalt ECF transporter T component CbiQ [Oscillospiraceae bacterium]